jgi:uncharacterized membrane protein YfcA
MNEWLTTYGALVLASLAAGVVNALAGGGTLLTFPALNAVLPAVIANGTSTTALMPGSLASVWAYRRELKQVRRWAMLLAIPSFIGGLIGVELVTQLDPKYFARLVPWLILLATVLFLSQPLVSRLTKVAHRSWPLPVVMAIQFAVAIYGGYFGAGIGIIMLAVFSFYGMTDIHEMNAVKTVQAVVVNVVAAAEFVRSGNVVWHYALVMAVAAIIGGYLGAHFGRRLNRSLVRWIVVAIGLSLSAYYFTRPSV